MTDSKLQGHVSTTDHAHHITDNSQESLNVTNVTKASNKSSPNHDHFKVKVESVEQHPTGHLTSGGSHREPDAAGSSTLDEPGQSPKSSGKQPSLGPPSDSPPGTPAFRPWFDQDIVDLLEGAESQAPKYNPDYAKLAVEIDRLESLTRRALTDESLAEMALAQERQVDSLALYIWPTDPGGAKLNAVETRGRLPMSPSDLAPEYHPRYLQLGSEIDRLKDLQRHAGIDETAIAKMLGQERRVNEYSVSLWPTDPFGAQWNALRTRGARPPDSHREHHLSRSWWPSASPPDAELESRIDHLEDLQHLGAPAPKQNFAEFMVRSRALDISPDDPLAAIEAVLEHRQGLQGKTRSEPLSGSRPYSRAFQEIPSTSRPFRRMPTAYSWQTELDGRQTSEEIEADAVWLTIKERSEGIRGWKAWEELLGNSNPAPEAPLRTVAASVQQDRDLETLETPKPERISDFGYPLETRPGKSNRSSFAKPSTETKIGHEWGADLAKEELPSGLLNAMAKLERWDQLDEKSRKLAETRSNLAFNGSIPDLRREIGRSDGKVEISANLHRIYRRPLKAQAELGRSYAEIGREATFRRFGYWPQDFGRLHGHKILWGHTRPQKRAFFHASQSSWAALDRLKEQKRLESVLEKVGEIHRDQLAHRKMRDEIVRGDSDLNLRLKGHSTSDRLRLEQTAGREKLVARVGREAKNLDLNKIESRLTERQFELLKEIRRDEHNHLKPLREAISRLESANQKGKGLGQIGDVAARALAGKTLPEAKILAVKPTQLVRTTASLYLKSPAHVLWRLTGPQVKMAVSAVQLVQSIARSVERGTSR